LHHRFHMGVLPLHYRSTTVALPLKCRRDKGAEAAWPCGSDGLALRPSKALTRVTSCCLQSTCGRVRLDGLRPFSSDYATGGLTRMFHAPMKTVRRVPPRGVSACTTPCQLLLLLKHCLLSSRLLRSAFCFACSISAFCFPWPVKSFPYFTGPNFCFSCGYFLLFSCNVTPCAPFRSGPAPFN